MSSGYPIGLKSIGDHIRKVRLDRHLLQRDVATIVGADKTSVFNWERGSAEPAIRFLPHIIGWLGYDPRPTPKTLADRLRHFREGRGMNRDAFARIVGCDPASVTSWETGEHHPTKASLRKIEEVIGEEPESGLSRESRGYPLALGR